VTVTLNQPAIDALLHSEAGPVGRDLVRRAVLVEESARQIIGETFYVRTGSLIRSVRSEVGQDTDGLRARVYCDPDVAPHAAYLEYGTRPHAIDPVNAPILVSRVDNPTPLAGPTMHVEHPGNPAFGFLREALGAFDG
jgi:hypothetical protein